MSETPEEYRKRREGLFRAEQRRAERRREQELRLRSMGDSDLLAKHERNCLYKSHRADKTRALILRRMRGDRT